jgi:hypothetical protein
MAAAVDSAIASDAFAGPPSATNLAPLNAAEAIAASPTR